MKKKQDFLERLVSALVKLQVVSEQEADAFVKEFKGRAKGSIDDFLIDEGMVTREILLQALQSIYGVPSFDVRGHFFSHQLLLFFPKDFLMRQAIIPLEVDDDLMTVVMANPENEDSLDVLARYASYNVNVLVGVKRDILDAIEEYYDEDVATADVQDQESDDVMSNEDEDLDRY